jgi:hypothetical protein
MGLDIVELFIRFEDEFELKIPDEIAATLETPRMVIDYLMTTPEIRNKGWSRDFVADKVWFLIKDERAVNISKYNEDSYFVNDMGMD